MRVWVALAVLGFALAAGVGRLVFLSGLGVAHYGQARRCTNPYFLSKLAAELELHRSGLMAGIHAHRVSMGHVQTLAARLSA